MKTVWSIGYEGRNVQEFIRMLRGAGIGIVADVRATPMSRKLGFSKDVLAAKLRRAGIEYVHLRSCGNPDRVSDAKYLVTLKRANDVADLQKVVDGRKRVAVPPMLLLRRRPAPS